MSLREPWLEVDRAPTRECPTELCRPSVASTGVRSQVVSVSRNRYLCRPHPGAWIRWV